MDSVSSDCTSKTNIEMKNENENTNSLTSEDYDALPLRQFSDENDTIKLKHWESENGVNNSPPEELSDISDVELEKRTGSLKNHQNDDECVTGSECSGHTMGLRLGLDKNKSLIKDCLEAVTKTTDDDALDFEAEEGECQDINRSPQETNFEESDDKMDQALESNSQSKNNEELEEGEVSDEDEKRPEESEPKPVCRFYTRGQCTWGMSCRFLHPGVTDKGNYTMFDMIRPVSVPHGGLVTCRSTNYSLQAVDYHDYRNERSIQSHRTPMHHNAPSVYPVNDIRLPESTTMAIESAWERGLRTAKEMMRKANKKKEQDMDFEEKKMNLPLSPDDVEKDSYFFKDRATTPEAVSYSRRQHFPESEVYAPIDRFERSTLPSSYDELDPFGRSTRYRELPPHRMPQYEDERRIRPTREVIVQRVEPVGRGDDWNDPWMRSKSPGGRPSPDRSETRKRDYRSYTSNSSYTSSSSTQSDSSSDSSSKCLEQKRKRYDSVTQKDTTSRKHGKHQRTLVPVQNRTTHRSPNFAKSPKSKRRNMKSPLLGTEKMYPPSPMSKPRKIATKKLTKNHRNRHKRSSSSSDTDSSDSSASNTASESGSSTSESSSSNSENDLLSKSRRTPRRIITEKNTKRDSGGKRSPISIEIKKGFAVGTSALVSPSKSVSPEKDTKKTRREELLKQLRAVEDAIAKKKSKLI